MNKYLLVIILLASILRLYRLSDVPPGVNRDEASIGYTAYSIMTTAKDEYGRFLPISFESFGDWKLPLYIYTTIPFVRLFGLSELTIRLPSALAGIASVAALYYVTYALFRSEKLALLSSLILAIMPWHIHISRVESEAIVATLCIILGSLMFLKEKLILSAIFFALTYWTYHGNHVSTSLLLIGLAIIYGKDFVKIPHWWKAVSIGAIITSIILSITLPADRTKLGGISIFGDPTVVHTKIELPRLSTGQPDALLTRLRYNKLTYAATTIVQNYLNSYGPQFLFIKGGGNRAHNIEGFGNLHPIEAPFLILGVLWLISQFKKKETKFILWWMAIGGVAAAITKDAPHSNRMLMVVPAFAITAAAGIFWVTKYKKFLLVLILCIYSLSLMRYLNQYYNHFAVSEAKHWGYAYKLLTPILFQSNKSVIMERPEASPYIYLLFYSGYSPKIYQSQAKRYPISSDGFTDVSQFGRFSFRPIDWQRDIARRNTLLVTEEVPTELRQKINSTIWLPDGSPKFYVLDTDL